jgi:hypothetical protein
VQQGIEQGSHACAACLDALGVLPACVVELVAVIVREGFGEPVRIVREYLKHVAAQDVFPGRPGRRTRY